jgi:hypothetical protein
MTTGADPPEDDADSADADEEYTAEVEKRDENGDDLGAESRAHDGADAAESEADEWRYSVAEVGDSPDAEEADEEGNVAGVLMRNEPLERESIDAENALFFLLGSLGTIAFIVLAIGGL